MEVAELLANAKALPPERWLGAANLVLPRGVTGVLVVAVAFQLASLTWALVPAGVPVTGIATRAASSSVAVSRPDYGALAASHLFGEAPEQAQAVVAPAMEAPDTTLPLSLTGILSFDGNGNGSAIVKNSRNEELAYYVGQEIELADGATLHAVYADRVLLDRGGRLEALRLPENLRSSSGSPPAPVAPLPQAQTAAAPLRDVINRYAAELAEIFRAAPHTLEGRVIGFRLTPGRNRAAFESLGLVPGDVVTEINGTPLDDLGRGAQIVQALGESAQASVTVLRDGVAQTLVLDTTELQSLGQNRR